MNHCAAELRLQHMKEKTCDRVGQGFSSPSMLYIKHGQHMFQMNKEILQVQEWTQK